MRVMIYHPDGGAKTVSRETFDEWVKKGWLELGAKAKKEKKRGRPKKVAEVVPQIETVPEP